MSSVWWLASFTLIPCCPEPTQWLLLVRNGEKIEKPFWYYKMEIKNGCSLLGQKGEEISISSASAEWRVPSDDMQWRADRDAFCHYKIKWSWREAISWFCTELRSWRFFLLLQNGELIGRCPLPAQNGEERSAETEQRRKREMPSVRSERREGRKRPSADIMGKEVEQMPFLVLNWEKMERCPLFMQNGREIEMFSTRTEQRGGWRARRRDKEGSFCQDRIKAW